jgi:hypothetical protein
MRRVLLAFAVTALAFAGCAETDDTGQPTTAPEETEAPPETSGSIDVADQTSDGTTITVASVTIEGATGFIAVHTDQDGKPGPVAGHAPIEEGTTTDVVVTLDGAVETGSYWPMLHYDAGEIGTYEFDPSQVDSGPDQPVTDGGKPVMKQITLTVE